MEPNTNINQQKKIQKERKGDERKNEKKKGGRIVSSWCAITSIQYFAHTTPSSLIQYVDNERTARFPVVSQGICSFAKYDTRTCSPVLGPLRAHAGSRE
jgi:hypothetical protein